MTQALLEQLQATLEREIPMCGHMGIQVHSYVPGEGLTLRAPLDQNFNHQRTGFAGSLNALCTVAGWGSVYLLLQEHDLPGSVLIRRSSIKYIKPVDSPEISAFCKSPDPKQREYFLEMLRDVGQAKIQLAVSIVIGDEPAVLFDGSYVVMDGETAGDPPVA
jgi:thioesterase domain-containing protein